MGLGLAVLAACGGGRDADDTASSSVSITTTISTTVDPTGGSETIGADTMESDTLGKLDVGGSADDSTGPEACESIDMMATVGLQPADIIIVIDNSGSMDFEANQVQINMNAFSSQIFLANIDAHVVLISQITGDTGVCIDPPLGSGGCPVDDNNPPGLTHIIDSVDSNNALQKIIEHHADWSPVMRATASKHIIVVTDDESDLSAADFQAMWAALDPSYVPYKVHAIAAPEGPVAGCLNQTSCCITSAAAGAVYIQLTTATGGVFGNLCDQEFQPIFDAVAQQVIQGSAIACEFAIPPPPEGEDFDPMQVNVEFFDGVGTLDIGNVENAAACAGVTDGWYYDDPAMPQTILLCPQTCDTIQGFTDAAISIQFGCATVPAG
jgi:hypothetical protein